MSNTKNTPQDDNHNSELDHQIQEFIRISNNISKLLSQNFTPKRAQLQKELTSLKARIGIELTYSKNANG
jgi:hypothetical protein